MPQPKPLERSDGTLDYGELEKRLTAKPGFITTVLSGRAGDMHTFELREKFVRVVPRIILWGDRYFVFGSFVERLPARAACYHETQVMTIGKPWRPRKPRLSIFETMAKLRKER